MDKLKFKEDLNEIYNVRLKLLKNRPENELDNTFTVNDINSESSLEVILLFYSKILRIH